MFSRIARRYDLANALLSGGLDALWRRRSARIVRGWRPDRVLDLATGSGVFAAAIARSCPGAMIVGADFCHPMLLRAQEAKRVKRLTVADAMRLPFMDGCFDVVTVAFGLRNMASWPGALEEMCRVLRPGGHLLVLDFSLPRGWWGGLYRFYLDRCLPPIAGMVVGERDPYEYLAESIGRFPSGDTMVGLIQGCGFTAGTHETLSGGIVSLYTATAGEPPAK